MCFVLKESFSHYKQEVVVPRDSLECAMFLKRVFGHHKQEVTLLNKRQKLSLSRSHKISLEMRCAILLKKSLQEVP